MNNVIIENNPINNPTYIENNIDNIRQVYYSPKTYPDNNIVYTGSHTMDGYKFLSFVVCPFKYDAKNKKLYLITDLNFSIELKQQPISTNNNKKRQDTYLGKNMREAIKQLTLNGNELENMYHIDPKAKRTTLETIGTSYKYIIVTNELLRPVFEKLAHWKTIKGVRAKVITVEDCCDEYPNYTSQLAIKTKLADYYLDGMEYALLGGDTDVIPAQICYLPPYTTDTSDTPADTYYSCLDKNFTWDANSNQIYGEVDDNVDLYPEFIVTRCPVSTSSEAEVFVNRIIEYESSPHMNGWNNSMLSCGNMLYNTTIKNNVQISDSQYQGEFVYENGVLPYWNGSFFELFDTYSDHPNGANYDATEEHFQEEFEKGYIFIDEFSHGWANKWGFLENWSQYKIDKAESLVNNSYSTITTIACYTNAFDKNSNNFPGETDSYMTCLSESFIRNPTSGIIAYFGSSREGWTSTSYYFDRKFYESLLSSSNKQFGRASMMAKNAYTGLIPTTGYNTYRWLIMTLNPIGDPEMPIFTDTPQNFTNINVNYSSGNLSVSTGIPNCSICVSSVSDNGENYYELSDSTNSANFSGVFEDCYLCITKQGYVPYIARVGNTVYLQNEDIVRNLSIFSTSTHVGSNVNNSMTQGPVSIHNGKTTNISTGSIYIQNNFEIKLGAELDIQLP